MTTGDLRDDRPGDPRTLNAWLGQLHWDVRFCRERHPSAELAAEECQGPLGHATLGETASLRQHVVFARDATTRATHRFAWFDLDATRFWTLMQLRERAYPNHPATQGTDDDDQP